MSEKEEKERGFKVTDRRSLGDSKEEPEKGAPEPVRAPDVNPARGGTEKPREPVSGGAQKSEMGRERLAHPGEAGEPMGPLNFSQFIMSLATSALIQMGDAKHPDAQGDEFIDIEAARQTIDMIAMLKEKTKGNLDDKEDKLLSNILAELRFRFVQKTGPKI